MNPIEPGELAIMKLVFGRESDGRYGIKHLVPIRLQAKPGDPEDHFKLRDDIVIAQPNFLSSIYLTLGQSIVPIVATIPGEDTMRCLGTGFFVSATGLLITAAHVVIDPIERAYGNVRQVGQKAWSMGDLNLGVMIAVNAVDQGRAWIYRKIEWAELVTENNEQPLLFGKPTPKLAHDIAVCQVEHTAQDIFQPLSPIQLGMRGTGLAVGKKATAIGYAAMRDTPLDAEREGIVGGDFNFDLYVSTGTIIEHFPDNSVNRRATTPGPCFSASLKLPAGMSGSPIFDDEGIYVHGVVSRGLEDTDGLANHGNGSMLAASMQLPIGQLNDKSLNELLSSGEHGMPRVNLAGG